MSTVSAVVLLYCIATAVAIGVRRSGVPYTVALVVVGLAVGWLGLLPVPHLTREMLFVFFLPGLLFEAAFHLDLRAFRQVWRSSVYLAVPGVLITSGVTALLLVLFSRLMPPTLRVDTGSALIFGAIVAATDPVAVTALFRQLKAPQRLTALVESESLFNDGTGVVLYSLIVAYATTASSSLPAAAGRFIVIAGGGVLLGAAIGLIVSRVIHRVDEAVIEIGLTVIAAYGSFVLAERIGVSGVLATVVAGMTCAREGRDLGMSPASRAAVESFWEYAAFALNSIVFLLIGFQVNALRLVPVFGAVLIAFVAMTAARGLAVLSLFLAGPVLREPIIPRWSVVLSWGGLRGALSIVLALALPDTLAGRDLIATLTIGVVCLSIVVQGLSMPPLLKALRLGHPGASDYLIS
jgi:monovalent cation:H+ antiporter, CPA1 family